MNDVCTGGNPRETSVADIEKKFIAKHFNKIEDRKGVNYV